MDSKIFSFYVIIYFILAFISSEETDWGKRFVGSIFASAIMTGITLYLWWLACIILFLIGYSIADKHPGSKGIIMPVTVLLIILTATGGIRFRNQLKEEDRAKERQQQELHQRAKQEVQQALELERQASQQKEKSNCRKILKNSSQANTAKI
ncbi:MAG: hypothetical protein Q4F00_12480 [bacterium]|nr:hypothetical protein [bacterium]